jgi:DNA-binding response OmpR family regulator
MSAKKNVILVIDDDPRIVRLLTNSLQMEEYRVVSAPNGLLALDILIDTEPDLILLDLMMPHMDGFEFCERVRTFSVIPIIILTALGQDKEKVRGLDLGADDYLVKPFSIDEMLARVRVRLRQTQTTAEKRLPILRIADLVIDYTQHRLMRKNEEIRLTSIEFALLSLLSQHAGRVLTQDFILEHVWGKGYGGESHMLQIAINRLRRKLEQIPSHPQYIKTKVGVGYYFALPEESDGLASLPIMRDAIVVRQ